MCHTSATYNADADGLLTVVTQHGRGNPFCARQIDHLTELVEVVELPLPVGADGEDIDVIFLYVVNLLTYIIFDDDLVGQSCRLDGLHSFQYVVAYVEFAAVTVEAVVGDTHDEVVAQCLGTAQQIDMTLVQQVVSSVGYYFLHA